MFLHALFVAAMAPSPIRCVALAPHFEGEASPAALTAMVDEIAALGANTVMVVAQWGQADVTSARMGPYQWGTDDAEVRLLVRHARGRGLEVLVFPIVRLAEILPGRWRGTLAPRDRAAWWASYEAFVLHYARLAAAEGATMLSVGSELGSMEADLEAWRRLIERVRAVFAGRLVYSANWDHYLSVGFWADLDLIGVNAYHPITQRDGASEAMLAAAWRLIRRRMTFWQAFMGRPLLITELGYPSVLGGARRPYHYGGEAPVDLEEQARAYRAFIEAWRDQPGFAGACVWLWTGRGGASDSGYMPKGKPLEGILRRWFAGDR